MKLCEQHLAVVQAAIGVTVRADVANTYAAGLLAEAEGRAILEIDGCPFCTEPKAAPVLAKLEAEANAPR